MSRLDPLRNLPVVGRLLPAGPPAWDLHGKVVLVTGGARGIGAAGAAELARRGAVPVLADVDEVALVRAAAQVGGSPLTTVTDVTDLASCEAAVAATLERHGRLDAVWANAGIGTGGPVELVDPGAWAKVVEVNLVGVFHTVRAALPAVIEARGHVAITASLASFAHAPMLSAYAASKAGVEAFADSLRSESAHQGVTVGTLHPSWIDTDMVRDGDEHSEAFARMRASLRGPFATTHPLETVVPLIADGFERRDSRVFLPGMVGVAFALRNAINSAPLSRDQERIAPTLRRLFAAQVERDGVRLTSYGPRGDVGSAGQDPEDG